MAQVKIFNKSKLTVNNKFALSNALTIYNGDCRNLIKDIPDQSLQLIITSPPYNIGKEYEHNTELDKYFDFQREIIGLCVNKLSPKGSICWQVGNYINEGKNGKNIIPLDTFLFPIFQEYNLFLRNRIVWHYRHGLHYKNRFSGRYETINWYTKTDNYVFNLDSIRIPQLYPGKRNYKGSKVGAYSSNPLGKNPGDVWDIPNVKSSHIEKTAHPCQFPITVVERLIKCLSNEGDIVFDPFLGSGTTTAAAVLNGRRAVGAEIKEKYFNIAVERTKKAYYEELKYRSDKAVEKPSPNHKVSIKPPDKNTEELF